MLLKSDINLHEELKVLKRDDLAILARSLKNKVHLVSLQRQGKLRAQPLEVFSREEPVIVVIE